jgi:CRP-like cAMP-binding protein
MARGAGVQALVDLAAASEEIRLEDGETLSHHGHEREHLHLVVRGRVDANRASPDVLRSFGPGDVVGGPAAFSDRAHAWTALARGPARLLAIPIEAWFDLAEEHFDLVLSMMAVFGEARDAIMEQLAIEAGPAGLVLT